jgi:taurine dioxygenase
MRSADYVATSDPAARLGAGLHRQGSTGEWVGPARHLADERERLASLEWEHLRVRQIGATLGAEIEGVDLTASLADDVIDEIRRALAEYKVIFFRDQPMTPQQHIAFARRFGDLEIHPFIPPNPDHPELVRFEKSAEVAGYENSWHHDVTWRETPSMGAVLHAISVPPVGGDTLFSDMYAAYDALPDEVKDKLDGLTAVHDFMRSFGAVVPADRAEELRERYPLVEHPVVVRHDVTGRRLLYVNINFTSHIVGLSPEENAELLPFLCRQAATVEHQVRFRWTDHAVAFWDNRAVQHYASSDYWPATRVMERASIVGGRPSA